MSKIRKSKVSTNSEYIKLDEQFQLNFAISLIAPESQELEFGNHPVSLLPVPIKMNLPCWSSAHMEPPFPDLVHQKQHYFYNGTGGIVSAQIEVDREVRNITVTQCSVVGVQNQFAISVKPLKFSKYSNIHTGISEYSEISIPRGGEICLRSDDQDAAEKVNGMNLNIAEEQRNMLIDGLRVMRDGLFSDQINLEHRLPYTSEQFSRLYG